MPDCSKKTKKYLYRMAPGLVALFPENMTNAATWETESNWLLDYKVGTRGVVTTHMCTYMCWFAQGSVDDGSLCYIPESGPPVPPGADPCEVRRRRRRRRRSYMPLVMIVGGNTASRHTRMLATMCAISLKHDCVYWRLQVPGLGAKKNSTANDDPNGAWV